MLSDSESDNDDLHQLTINEHFAKAYDYKKEREELSKLKEKYGSDYDGEGGLDSEDSEDDTTEDEDGEELTPAVDAAILRTLARIKKKDPAIYDEQKSIFQEEQQTTSSQARPSRKSKRTKESKPLLMREHILNSTLNPTSRSPSPQPLTHAQEQAALRVETIQAFHKGTGGDEEEDDDLLVPREKIRDELEYEEEEYRDFLKRQVGEDIEGLITVEKPNDVVTTVIEERADTGEASNPRKKRKKEKRKEESDHDFLMNYILNRGWVDRSSKRVPTYNEITGGDSPEPENAEEENQAVNGNAAQDDGLFDEDEFDDVVDVFESSYNFRFEEPDATELKSHPRVLPDVVRRADTTRKEARERKKERKEEKLLKKREEVKRMKALKMKEIQEKLARIGREGGKDANDEALAALDLEGDWDPESYDRQIAGIYQEDDPVEADAEKPIWVDDIDISDIYPPEASTSQPEKKKKKKKKKEDDYDEDDGVDIDEMDADVELPPMDDEQWDGSEEMRKRKLDEYMNELYEMEFNDMVGDMPTRFKYLPVLPQTYGLTQSEILMADDKDLNQYMGVKKLAPYRKAGTWDQKRGERLKELKTKLKDRMGRHGAETLETQPQKKRKGKKERQKAKQAVADTEE